MLPQEDMIDLVAGNWLSYEIELETEFPLRWLPSAFLNLLDYIDQKYLLFCPCQSYAMDTCKIMTLDYHSMVNKIRKMESTLLLIITCCWLVSGTLNLAIRKEQALLPKSLVYKEQSLLSSQRCWCCLYQNTTYLLCEGNFLWLLTAGVFSGFS